MDLLFKRYTDPFLLINQMIMMSCFADFIFELLHKDDEDKLWDLYLHKVETDKSFDEFKNDAYIQNEEITQEDLETTINYSTALLQDFNPQQ